MFIESSIFERICPRYLDDDEYAELQQFMVHSPEAGALVPGSGGVRMYAKAKYDTVPAHILKQLLEAFRNE